MANKTDTALKTTPLDRIHVGRGAKMVGFAGYSMPVHYPNGILREHRHTRSAASLFDVSHMGQVRLNGPNAAEAFETLVPSDLQRLNHGQCQYSVLTNDTGGVIDDLIVTNLGDHLFVVINSARKDHDIAYIRDKLGNACDIDVLEDQALVALQGPKAAEVFGRHASAAKFLPYMTGSAIKIGGYACFVSRSGYTGEDGYEISVAAEDARDLAEIFLAEPEVEPAGLGARDSLRLEAGFCLYGQDLTEEITPVEANIAWIIGQRRRDDGGFPGADVIQAQLRDGPKRKRVGLTLGGKAPARAGAEICTPDGASIGIVTSGGFAASVDGPIAMGYVEAAHAIVDTSVHLMVRGKPLAATITQMPFVPDPRPKL